MTAYPCVFMWKNYNLYKLPIFKKAATILFGPLQNLVNDIWPNIFCFSNGGGGCSVRKGEVLHLALLVINLRVSLS